MGRYKNEFKWYDLYYCDRCDSGTLIARYSSTVYEYASAPLNVLLYAGYGWASPLVEAARRQIRVWRGRD